MDLSSLDLRVKMEIITILLAFCQQILNFNRHNDAATPLIGAISKHQYTACHNNVRNNAKKDGGISVVAKKRSAIGTFF